MFYNFITSERNSLQQFLCSNCYFTFKKTQILYKEHCTRELRFFYSSRAILLICSIVLVGIFKNIGSIEFSYFELRYLFSIFNTEQSRFFFITYFFCTFCKNGLVLLNPMNSHNIFSLKLASFEKVWKPIYAKHYFWTEVKNEELCRQKNYVHVQK